MNFQTYIDQFITETPFKIKTAFNGSYYKDEDINEGFGEENIYYPKPGQFQFLKFQYKLHSQLNTPVDELLLAQFLNSVLDSLFYRLFISIEQLACQRSQPNPAPVVNSIQDFSNLFNTLSTADSAESRIMLPINWISALIRRLNAFQQFGPLGALSKRHMRTALNYGPSIIGLPKRISSKLIVFAYDYSFVTTKPDFKLVGDVIHISIGYDIQNDHEICIYNV